MEKYLLEGATVKVLNGPADLDTVVAGARISMKDAKRVTIIAVVGTGIATTLSLALKQHNAASAGTSKALAISNPYFVKTAAATAMTKVEPGAAQDTYPIAALNTAAGVVAFEVLEEDLDTNGGFTHISLDVADTTAAKLGTVIAIIRGLGAPSYSVDV